MAQSGLLRDYSPEEIVDIMIYDMSDVDRNEVINILKELIEDAEKAKLVLLHFQNWGQGPIYKC